ncbi:hypothetical protein QBC39DRAFT_358831 [Podospora conica]|nr:hypothetical protein QBC39DRAFT_358831 [Schizothecium conicum]
METSGSSVLWQLRARQLQRYWHVGRATRLPAGRKVKLKRGDKIPTEKPYSSMITQDHLDRAALLFPDYAWKAHDQEEDWPDTWEQNRRSLRGFLSHRTWLTFPTVAPETPPVSEVGSTAVASNEAAVSAPGPRKEQEDAGSPAAEPAAVSAPRKEQDDGGGPATAVQPKQVEFSRADVRKFKRFLVQKQRERSQY